MEGRCMTAPMTREKLLPCPFCGNRKPRLLELAGDWYVECGHPCTAQMVLVDSEADAIANWNTRSGAQSAWHLIARERPPKDEMFIWAYRLDGKWRIGLGYNNVSGAWSDAYGSQAPQYPTHWAPMLQPPETAISSADCGVEK